MAETLTEQGNIGTAIKDAAASSTTEKVGAPGALPGENLAWQQQAQVD